MNRKRTSFLILLLFIAVSSCRDKQSAETSRPIALEEESNSNANKVRLIFYNMYLPTEMSRLFERVGANYQPNILNSADNISRYSTPQQISLNLGIYGVDLSYTRIFDQHASTAKYFSSIQLLSDKLGIPHNYYEDILKGLDKYYDNKDSLTLLAGEIFERADKYLRDHDQDPNAALILTGGWIEALYIASKIAEADPNNYEIMERIAEQKYSLNSIISLLGNYQEDINFTGYILMLKRLKKAFDKFEIYYAQDSFTVDTINKLISANEYAIDISPEIISEIDHIITEIRMEIVK